MYEEHNAELIAAVAEHYEDELEDIEHYRHLAHKARTEGCHHLERLFTEIGNDEFTHAYYLRDYLIRKGVYDPDGKHKSLEAKWIDVTTD
jgi:rubrerythrin